MPGLDPGIQGPHALSLLPWIAGSGPAMTAFRICANASDTRGRTLAGGCWLRHLPELFSMCDAARDVRASGWTTPRRAGGKSQCGRGAGELLKTLHQRPSFETLAALAPQDEAFTRRLPHPEEGRRPVSKGPLGLFSAASVARLDPRPRHDRGSMRGTRPPLPPRTSLPLHPGYARLTSGHVTAHDTN
jgi:hypothetical protein